MEKMTENEITQLCKSLEDLHIYDPQLVNMTDEEYTKFLEAQFEHWEDRDGTIHN